MAKKTPTPDVDDLLGDDTLAAPEAAPKKAKPAAKSKAAPAAKTKTKPAAKSKAAPAAKTKAKPAAAEAAPAADGAIRKALLKVKKAQSYAAIAEAGDFNIRSVRRTARAMRDAGEIELVREGQLVYVQAAV